VSCLGFSNFIFLGFFVIEFNLKTSKSHLTKNYFFAVFRILFIKINKSRQYSCTSSNIDPSYHDIADEFDTAEPESVICDIELTWPWPLQLWLHSSILYCTVHPAYTKTQSHAHMLCIHIQRYSLFLEISLIFFSSNFFLKFVVDRIAVWVLPTIYYLKTFYYQTLSYYHKTALLLFNRLTTVYDTTVWF
jgi:hypothetical protein